MGTAASSLNGDTVSEKDVRRYLDGMTKQGEVNINELKDIFSALQKPKRTHSQAHFFSFQSFLNMLELHGLLPDDPRISDTCALFQSINGSIAVEEFENARRHSVLINRALSGHLIVPDFEELRDEFQTMYHDILPLKHGENAQYIPELNEEHVDPNLFGVSVCTIDGQRYNIGDTDIKFCVEACGKPISYCIAQELLGVEEVHKHVGMEPSGRPVSDLCLDTRHKDADLEMLKQMKSQDAATFKPRLAYPHNPMTHGGAIMISSFLYREKPLSERFAATMTVWSDLVGSKNVSFNNTVFLSEEQNSAHSLCMAYMMQYEGVFEQGTDIKEALRLYLMTCSIEVTCGMLARVAATLANGGVNPLTGKRVFKSSSVKNTLSLMGTCGMYDHSGEFFFTMGFPVKSGASGALMIVIPGLMGICTYSPHLDIKGISVRGLAFCEKLSQIYAFHNFESLTNGSKKYPTKSDQIRVQRGLLIWAASENNVTHAAHLILAGADPNYTDLDGRTALHVASSCGFEHMARYLLANGADLSVRDRFGATPLDNAIQFKHQNIAKFLSNEKSVVVPKKQGKDLHMTALQSTNGNTLEKEVLLQSIEREGIPRSDYRVLQAFNGCPDIISTEHIDLMIAKQNIVRKCLMGNLVIRDFQQTYAQFQAIFEHVKSNNEGEVSQSIPAMGKQNPNLFGVGVCSVDGQRMRFGDYTHDFSTQSCSKCISYCIALEENGPEKLSRHMGREPSGRPFNEILLDRRKSPAVPHNPMINAGAIMSCALIKPDLPDAEDRIQYCLEKYWGPMCGHPKKSRHRQVYDRTVYKSESANSARNRCISYMMSDTGCFPEEYGTSEALMANLEFYIMSCAVLQNADSLSIIAGTLANGGVCPITGERIFSTSTVRDCLSLMYSCGMYDYSGEFAFECGIPAKCALSGVLMIIIPNRMGIAIFSPRVNNSGISERGLDFCRKMTQQFKFHIHDRVPGSNSLALDPSRHNGNNNDRDLHILLLAASKGDIRAFKLLHNVCGAELVNCGNYDGRTAMHIACQECKLNIIEYILTHSDLKTDMKDRWGKTPLDVAIEGNFTKIVSLLRINSSQTSSLNSNSLRTNGKRRKPVPPPPPKKK